ncbi:MAG: hypothetical protein FWE91_07020 [Defluviitaleaceae bacterium]|nr:hypothetical protein [Defluviitaleaceae bacterium]MCL2836714.1 hypothetical protein [Defluviitaleaceae bacterium]
MDKYVKTDYAPRILKDISDTLGIQQLDAVEIFHYILNNRDLLAEDERISEIGSGNEESKGLLVANGLYHINIKIVTLQIIAKILDSSFARGFASKAMDIAGFNTQIITKVSSENGELCILKELMRNKEKIGNKTMLERNKKECVNNDIECKFRKEYKCLSTPNDVHDILQKLQNMGLCKELTNGQYKYTL